jgi:membrane-bound lytic murein transglycosylase D
MDKRGNAGKLGMAGLVLALGVTAGVDRAHHPKPAGDTPSTVIAHLLPSTPAVLSVDGNASAEKTASADVTWDLPDLNHPRVDMWVGKFTTGFRDDFATYLDHMADFQPMISAKLAARGMPQDLLYLALIESGGNPKAYSSAKASGLWQFIEGTAERYGLKVDGKVDERNDPAKETDAALRYLTDLHDRFGSWYLAAAAYNTGEGRVAKVMMEVTGHERGTDEDYYRISEKLPAETRDYVPKMIAAARIAKEPAKYGFDVAATGSAGS